MPTYYFEDGSNVRYNQVTVVGDGPCSYNAILSTSRATVSTEPVTTQNVKDYGKIDTTADDTLIGLLITAARDLLEKHTMISFVERVIVAEINNSLGGQELPYGPVISMTSVVDADGTTIATDDYELRGLEFKRVHLPETDFIKLTYVGGYGGDDEDNSIPLPEALKTALKAQTLWMYQHRHESSEPIAPIAKQLLAPFKRF